MMEVVPCLNGTFDVICNGDEFGNFPNIFEAVRHAEAHTDGRYGLVNIVVGAFRAVETVRR